MHPPPFEDRMFKELWHVPPLHDPEKRYESEITYLENPLFRIYNVDPDDTSNPAPYSESPSRPAQGSAQPAFPHSLRPQRRTQKEEMLSERQFYPYDKELSLDRERCAAACWLFNNLATPPINGVSPNERARLFLEILQPRDPVLRFDSKIYSCLNVGKVGRRVSVEVPFHVDSGYNVTIAITWQSDESVPSMTPEKSRLEIIALLGGT